MDSDKALRHDASHPRRSAAQALRTAALLLITGLLVWTIGQLEFLRPVERRALQQLLIWWPPETSRDVVVVRITDADYAKEFGNQSPLDRKRLEDLVNVIARARPCAIGLDIDTADARFTNMTFGHDVPVIWAQAARFEDGVLRPIAAAGGDATVRAGVAMFRFDSDGVLRRYRRAWAAHQSFACAVILGAKQSCGRLPSTDGLHDAGQACEARDSAERYIQYAQDRQGRPELTFTVGELLSPRDGPAETRQLKEQQLKALQDKIVIIGGEYRASGDAERATPVGPLPGVDVIAHTITTDLHGGGFKPIGRFTVPVMFLVNEYLLTSLIVWLGPLWAAASLVLVIPTVAALFALFTDGPFRYLLLVVAFLFVLNGAKAVVSGGKKTFGKILESAIVSGWRSFRSGLTRLAAGRSFQARSQRN